MEAKISTFNFKLDRNQSVIEVFDGPMSERPAFFIQVKDDITEKEFHVEISSWFMYRDQSY